MDFMRNFFFGIILSIENMMEIEFDLNFLYEKYILEKFFIFKIIKIILYVFGFFGNILVCILWF